MWSREVTWQIISALSQCPWLPALPGWWNTERNFYTGIRMTPQGSDPVRLRDKLNTYLHFQNLQMTHGHQTMMTYRGRLTLKATWLFDHATKLRSRYNLKNLISTFIRLMVSKVGRVLTSGKRFSTQAFKSSTTSFFVGCQNDGSQNFSLCKIPFLRNKYGCLVKNVSCYWLKVFKWSWGVYWVLW